MAASHMKVIAVVLLAGSTWGSPIPDPQGGISVFRTGNGGVAAGSTYSSGGGGYSGGGGGYSGGAVYGGGPGGYTVTSFNGGGPGQVYYFGDNGRPLRSGSSGTYYNTRSNPGGVTVHRFGNNGYGGSGISVGSGYGGTGVSVGSGYGGSGIGFGSVFPRTSFFPGVGTGAYAGGGTGAFSGTGGAFASAGGLGVWAGK